MGRKQSVDMNDTTLETWKAVIPQSHYRISTQEKEIIVLESVKIQYGGFDKTETVNKFQSSEYVKIFLDQAEELTRDDYAYVKGTLRKKINGQEPMYKVLLTANPAEGWLKDEFITTQSERRAFIKALPTDNPFLAEGYIKTLEEAFQHRPELLRAYVYGDWDVLTGHDMVIKAQWLDAAEKMDTQRYNDKRKIVACDVAWEGLDETVIYVFEGRKVIDQMIYGQKDPMETCGNIVALKRKHNADRIIVDGIGLGAGVVARLSELGESVINFKSSESPDVEADGFKYKNKRAQAWWTAAESFAKGEIALHKDIKLRNQLASCRYKPASNGSIQIRAKDEQEDSPDRADAFIMGIYGLQFVPVREQEVWRQEYSGVRRNTVKSGNTYGWQAPKNNRLPVGLR